MKSKKICTSTGFIGWQSHFTSVQAAEQLPSPKSAEEEAGHDVAGLIVSAQATALAAHARAAGAMQALAAQHKLTRALKGDVEHAGVALVGLQARCEAVEQAKTTQAQQIERLVALLPQVPCLYTGVRQIPRNGLERRSCALHRSHIPVRVACIWQICSS